jgi:hypothetical protein
VLALSQWQLHALRNWRVRRLELENLLYPRSHRRKRENNRVRTLSDPTKRRLRRRTGWRNSELRRRKKLKSLKP